jgi:hypothetical protein
VTRNDKIDKKKKKEKEKEKEKKNVAQDHIVNFTSFSTFTL